LNILHFIAILLVLNIVIFHLNIFVEMYFWGYKKLCKPKFKAGEYVVVDSEVYVIIHVSSLPRPYSYFCLPLNKTSGRLTNYYPQKALKPVSDLTKALF
jgi:hypothetical protein